MEEFVFTVINDEGEAEYYTYSAYSYKQALYLLSLDGISVGRVVDYNSYGVAFA